VRGRYFVCINVLLAAVMGAVAVSTHELHSGLARENSPVASAAWRLVWADEFNEDGRLDLQNWTFDLGGTGWGNRELQYYTGRSPENVVVQDGSLVIRALNERYSGPDGVKRNYTSTRLHTRRHFSATYGRFEARVKLPIGKGLWPAFWMLGDDIGEVGWPSCGEIDVFENKGSEPATIHGALHGPGYSHGSGLTASYSLPSYQRFTDDFHTFAVEWEPSQVRFYVDHSLYKVATPSDMPSGKRWVFDHPFFLVLNLAVGGNWPGSPDESTIFPQTMNVDYVRVYQHR
jgi:beta-glucanase (GH16 family)